MIHEYFKAVAGVFAGTFAWLGNSVAQVAAPDSSWTLWLDRYGLPLVMLVIAMYVCSVLYKALRTSETSRMADKDAALEMYRQDFVSAQDTRNTMIAETRETKEALREFTETMKSRPCGIQPPRSNGNQ